LPRTLWQKGAIFSNRLSRASVSAGKYVPGAFINSSFVPPHMSLTGNKFHQVPDN